MATLLELERNIGRPLGLAYTGADKAEIDQRVNDGVVDLLRRTRCYVAKGTLDVTAGVSDYTLDSAILNIRTIFDSSSSSRFEQVSEQRITDMQTYSDFSTTDVFFYALSGANLLILYPTPAAADSLAIRYVPRPTALTLDTHDPSDASYGGIPEEFHYGIELYALWKMADSTDDSSSGQGERYRLEYEGDPSAPIGTPRRQGFVGRMKAEIQRKAGPLGRTAARPRGRRRHNVFNDQRF